MLQKIKRWLRQKLFANEELEYQAKLIAVSSMKEQASIVALAREQLKSFYPKSITSTAVANFHSLSIYDDLTPEERDELINNVHALYSNPALSIVINYIIRNQIIYGQMEADSLLSLNFTRGTVNGLRLLEEQINEIEGVWKAEHAVEEPYNKFSVT